MADARSEWSICARCGYDVASLRSSAVCPECGSPLADRGVEAPLRHEDPERLRRLHLGLVLVLVAWAGGAAAAVAAGLKKGGFSINVDTIVIVIGAACAWMMALAGWWLVSAVEPRFSTATRRGARVLAINSLLVMGGAGGALAARWTGATRWRDDAVLLGIAMFAFTLHLGAAAGILQQIAWRAKDSELESAATRQLWLGFAFVLTAVVSALVATVWQRGAIGLGLAAILGVLWLMRFVGVLDHARRRTGEAIRASEAVARARSGAGTVRVAEIECAAPGARCVRCGYDIAGQPRAGVCPECSFGIADSLRGHMLRNADSAYVRWMLRGARLELWSLVTVVALLVVAIAGLVGGSFMSATPWLQVVAAWARTALGLLVLPAIGVAWVVGLWMLSVPDPARAPVEGVCSARRQLRAAAIVIGGSAIGAVILGRIETSLPPGYSAAMAGAGARALIIVCAAALALHVLSLALFVRSLARRTPDAELVATTRTTLIILAVGAAAAAVAGVEQLIPSALGALGAAAAFVLTLAPLAVVGMYIALIAGLVGALERARSESAPSSTAESNTKGPT